MRSFNVQLLLVGDGGYTIRSVVRWCYETGVALGVEVDDKMPPHEYYKYFGPDYTLHVAPSNMENKNSNQFLDEIRTKLLENLLRTCSQRSVSGTSTRERNIQRKTKIKKIQIHDMKNMIQTWKVDNCKPLSKSLHESECEKRVY